MGTQSVQRTSPPRILMILEAGNEYPSGLIRGSIYLPMFEQAGIPVICRNRLFSPLVRVIARPPFGLRRLAKLFEKPLQSILGALSLIQEQFLLQEASRSDVVYMSKVVSPRFIRRLRRCTRARIVLDFGDALWGRRRQLKDFSTVLRTVDLVTTDNEYTKAAVIRFNPNCQVIPDSPQLEFFDRFRAIPRRRSEKIVIGWVGSAGTAYNLFHVWEALEDIFSKNTNIEFRLVGIAQNSPLLPPFENVNFTCRSSYNQQEMVEEVFGFDIGIFPLQDVAESYARGILKATVYMSAGVPVICSPVGQLNELIVDGVNGILAKNRQEWVEGLQTLIESPELRGRLGQGGLLTVRDSFSLERCFSKLKRALEL